MANVLQVTTTINNTTTGEVHSTSQKQVTTAGDDKFTSMFILTTIEKDLDLPDGTAEGFPDVQPGHYCYIKNHDATNFIQIGKSAGNYFMRLAAGESATLPLDDSVSNLFCKAGAGSCKTEVVVYAK